VSLLVLCAGFNNFVSAYEHSVQGHKRQQIRDYKPAAFLSTDARFFFTRQCKQNSSCSGTEEPNWQRKILKISALYFEHVNSALISVAVLLLLLEVL
jgi:hypothetical protein